MRSTSCSIRSSTPRWRSSANRWSIIGLYFDPCSGSAIARGQRASSAANGAAFPTIERRAHPPFRWLPGPNPWNSARNSSAADRTGRSAASAIAPAVGWSRVTRVQSSPDSSNE